MRKAILIISLLYGMCTYSQVQSSDVGRITIHAVVPEREDLPENARKLLQTKLSQIITASDVADDEYCVRFVLTAKINVLSKDILPGPPQRISQRLEVTLMMGDIEANKVFSQLSIQVHGVGQSLDKCFLTAFKNINPQNAEIQQFMSEAKSKVVAFYQTSCNDILAQAQKLINIQRYEDAMMLLGTVPDVSTDCFSEVVKMSKTVYADMINSQGEQLLNSARAIWAANPTRDGAHEAVRVLSQVNYAAKCQPGVEALFAEIDRKVDDIDRREWNQQMQEYRDQKAREEREWKRQLQEHADNVETEHRYIRACRDVAIAYAKSRPKVINRTINYNRIILW